MKMFQGIPRFRAVELARMRTITQGHTADLKYEVGGTRLWLHRTGVADGEPFARTVTVERFDRRTSQWTEVYRYDGDHQTRVAYPQED